VLSCVCQLFIKEFHDDDDDDDDDELYSCYVQRAIAYYVKPAFGKMKYMLQEISQYAVSVQDCTGLR